ncbi:Calcium/calmodulin-dependent protein kinase [Smittium culicis]|uniref:Calcium/calmodulin-dependent protein kinase n=1 Tax=Smittium culicis TaxID=133412 RepID=A0A1R1YCW3_9FUNG|nr:Calcium/calmodulin-dependent protein kinase [Smittium culicis]
MPNSQKPSIWKFWERFTTDQSASKDRKRYYKLGRVIGSGTFGEVKQAIFTPTNQEVAVKIIKKTFLEGDENMVKKEIQVVESLDHPNIVKLLDWFQSKDKYYLVFQLCTGGELFEKICERGHFSERDAVPIIRIAFSAIAYLHSLNVIHRDIKPENFLFLNKEPNSPLMLADFGISRIISDNNEILTTVCGSYGYTAPEILLRKGHSKPVDIWSLGTVTFSILCGYSPFWKYEKMPEMLFAMQNKMVEFDERYWWGISEEAKDFIIKCLDPNPETRMTADQAVKHPWLTGVAASSHDILPIVRENFNPRKVFRQAVAKIQAVNRMRASISVDQGTSFLNNVNAIESQLANADSDVTNLSSSSAQYPDPSSITTTESLPAKINEYSNMGPSSNRYANPNHGKQIPATDSQSTKIEKSCESPEEKGDGDTSNSDLKKTDGNANSSGTEQSETTAQDNQ